MTLGNFSIKSGSTGNDTLSGSSLQVVLGLVGNDRLTADVSPISSSTSLLAGGLGDDTYVIPTGKGATILDSGGTDSVVFPFVSSSTTIYFYTTDNQTLVIGDTATNSLAAIVNWQNSANRIEKFIGSDGNVTTYDQLVSGYTASPYYGLNIPLQQTNINANGYLSPTTGLTPTTSTSFLTNIGALAVGKPITIAPLADFKKEPAKYMESIRDYDGNNLGGASSWKSLGDADINGDGTLESILVNPNIERFASVGAVGGNVDFSKYGLNGDTRVVGIYLDPTLKSSPQNIGGPFDSQRRFQNDLKNDNLKLLAAGDYNKDGFQDMYFKLGDGSAVLRALMFKDGNIQYANYQSKTDLTNFMTTNNVNSSIWGGWI
jgi:hypothetical protein